MAWSGKLVGGLIGGMLGGPVGAGVGVTLGHMLGDGGRALELQRLDWQHHAFRASGPGMVLTPVWVARRQLGRDVRVRVRVLDVEQKATVTPEDVLEEVALPHVFVPYAALPDEEMVAVSVKLKGADGADDSATFRVRTPNAVRRLGGSGPARAVMALVACARADGGALTAEHARFIRESLQEGLELDDDGRLWLRAWLRELAAADVGRLRAERVAERLRPHLDAEGGARLLGWMWRGVAEAWPGAAQAAYVETVAAALGLSATQADPTDDDGHREAWAALGVPPGTTGDALRDAWRALVQQWHPDHAKSPEDAMVRNRRLAELNAAYRLLSR